MKAGKYGKLKMFLKKHLFNLPALSAAVILGIVMIYSSEIQYYIGADYFDILGGIQNSYTLGLAAYIIPIIVCFPYIMRFSEERISGYQIYNELRTGRKLYIFYKLRDAVISGGMIMLAGITVYTFYSMCYCKVYRMELLCNGDGFFGTVHNPEPNIYYAWIMEGLGILVYLVNILFLMAFSMFWAVVGTVVSVFVTNRRVAVVSPLLFKRFLEYIIPDSMHFLIPTNLSMSGWVTEQFGGGIWYGILYITITFISGWLIIYIKHSVDAAR